MLVGALSFAAAVLASLGYLAFYRPIRPVDFIAPGLDDENVVDLAEHRKSKSAEAA